jgi:cyclomaltodextrinase
MKMNDLPLGKYQHYKGKEYEVLGTAKHTETMESFVVYRALYGDRGTWIRPKSMFLESVSIDGKEVPRFKFIGNELLRTTRSIKIQKFKV